MTVTWRLEGAVNVGPGLDVMPYIVETELRAKGDHFGMCSFIRGCKT